MTAHMFYAECTCGSRLARVSLGRILELEQIEPGLWLAHAAEGNRPLGPARLPPLIEAADAKSALREAKRRLRKWAGWRALWFVRIEVKS